MPEISMTETLFGGIIFAAFLFFGLRKFGAANFWAGVLSGAIPFLMYLVYASQHWEGGDVLAIHFAVYLSNACVLTIYGSMRQKKQRMHWAPRLIIAFFIFLVVLNAVLLSIASRGLPTGISSWILPNPEKQKVHTAFPGTVPHDKNKSYQGQLALIEQLKEQGWQVELRGFDSLVSGQAADVELQLLDKEGAPISNAKVQLGLWRIANSRDDLSLQMHESEPGLYRVELMLKNAGRWVAEVIIETEDGYLRSQKQLFLES
jgi:nitrogen fixation protein FixH